MRVGFAHALVYANRLLLIGGVLALVVSIGYLIMILAFGWHGERVIYWFAFSEPTSDPMLLFVIFLLIGLGYIVAVRILPLRSVVKPSLNRSVDIVLLILFASMFMCIANFVHFWQAFGYNEHIETVQLDDHVYHLQFYSHDPVESYSHFYFLYECDSLDLLCHKIYTIPRTTGGITPDVEEIMLVPDDEAQTISLQVNGEIVYTHHP